MNFHQFNIYAGALIGSLLFFLLLNFVSEMIFIGSAGAEHEGKPLAFAVKIEAVADAPQEAAVDWAALIAAADRAKGAKLFRKCKACHKLENGVNGIGPSLWGVVGRDIASVEGFSYSDALTGLDGDWGLESLQAFLEAPGKYAPNTEMRFGGLKAVEDRVNLIVYLNQADGSPEPLIE